MKTTQEILNLITTHQETCINLGAGHDCAALIYEQGKEIRIAIEELVAERDTMRDDLQIEKINTECYLTGAKKMHEELRTENEAVRQANLHCVENFRAVFAELEETKSKLADAQASPLSEEYLDILRAENEALKAKLDTYLKIVPAPTGFIQQPCIDGGVRIPVTDWSAA